MPQFDFSTLPSQVFWLLVTFAAFYFFNKYIGLPNALRQMRERDKSYEELKAKLKRAEEKIEQLTQKQSQIRIQAAAEYKKIEDETLSDIQAELHQFRRDLHINTLEEVDKFDEDVNEKLKGLSSYKEEVADEVLRLILSKMFNDTMGDIDKLTSSNGPATKRKYDA